MTQNIELFKNSILINTAPTPGTDINTKPVNSFHVGAYGGTDDIAIAEGGLIGKIMCIRMYNRPLSNDELLHNYNIDKKRFGL